MKRHILIQELPVARDGWLGAWDALISALTGQPRVEILRPYEFSVYTSTPVEIEISATCISETYFPKDKS